jgi:hypothetical protein
MQRINASRAEQEMKEIRRFTNRSSQARSNSAHANQRVYTGQARRYRWLSLDHSIWLYYPSALFDNASVMKRPIGVTVIAFVFLLAGVYLCSVGVMKLFSTGALTMLRPMPFVHAVGFVSPYWTLLAGVAWALVAWGLLQVRDWARFTATLMLGIGIAWALPMVITRMHFGWRMLALCLEIALRAAAIWYLLSPSVLDIFIARRVQRRLS